MTKRTLIVGGDLEQAAKRVAEAWHRAERGEPIEAEDNVTFTSWSALLSSPAQILHIVQDDKGEALISPPIGRPGARGARGGGV